MKTWDDWSDEDLANAILVVIHGEVINMFCLSDCKTYIYDCGVIGESFYRVDLIDINNPADMWPIMVKNKITVGYDGDGVFASQGELSEFPWVKFDYASGTCTALRAAAIVFLIMNGVKPE